jgi:hypothetical protein
MPLQSAGRRLGSEHKTSGRGAKREIDGARIRLDQYLDQWLKTLESRICAKTYEGYESLLEKYIRQEMSRGN